MRVAVLLAICSSGCTVNEVVMWKNVYPPAVVVQHEGGGEPAIEPEGRATPVVPRIETPRVRAPERM